MDHHSQKFEKLLHKYTENLVENPSDRVLRKLRLRLWTSDFFSFNFRKVNFIYSVVMLGGIVSGIYFLQKPVAKLETTVMTEDTASDKPGLVQNEEVASNDGFIQNAVEDEVMEITSETAPEAIFEIEKVRGCAPMLVQFTDRSMKADFWEWDFGTGERSVKQNPEYLYSKAGHYKATLTVRNKNGNKDIFSKEIEVLPGPMASMDIDRDNSEIASRKIIFKNNSRGATSYSWDFGDNNRSDVPNASHQYESFGVYLVKLIARADNGCSDTARLENKFIERNYELSFPPVFRPNPYDRNNNGFYESAGNEAFIFFPKNFGVTDYRLTVYTMNGILVFETTNIRQGWNGYIGGQLAPEGLYSYRATGAYPNGKKFELEGRVKVLVENYD